jgi:hypothetical protein
LDSKASDELRTEAVVVVPDDEFVKVFTEQIEHNTDMLSKDDEILNLDNVGRMFSIFLLDVCQQLYLNKRLLIELGLVLDNLQRQILLLLMVIHFNHLPITPLPHLLEDLIPICNMVLQLIHILIPTMITNK